MVAHGSTASRHNPETARRPGRRGRRTAPTAPAAPAGPLSQSQSLRLNATYRATESATISTEDVRRPVRWANPG